MTSLTGVSYHVKVAAALFGARDWIVAGALFLIAVLASPLAADANVNEFPVGDQAVVQVVAVSALVTIHTWNRSVVAVDWADDAPFTADHKTMTLDARLFVRAVSVQEKNTANDRTVVTLPPEDFPLSRLTTTEPHDAVLIDQPAQAEVGGLAPPTRLTVTIPATTGLLLVRVDHGVVRLSDYHGTTSAALNRGRLIFANVGGDAFVQPLNGRFYAVNSQFDHLRIRSNSADEVFESCRVKEISATTLTGNIVYDNGSFDPGLAHFESDRGSIALGINGGADIGAHSADGHVWSELPSPSEVPALASGPADRVRVAGEGGPLVNALSSKGDVFVYSGSMTDGEAERDEAWRPMVALLQANRVMAHRMIGTGPSALGAPAPQAAAGSVRRGGPAPSTPPLSARRAGVPLGPVSRRRRSGIPREPASSRGRPAS